MPPGPSTGPWYLPAGLEAGPAQRPRGCLDGRQVRAQGREESADPQESGHPPASLTGGLWPAPEAACPGSHQKPQARPGRTSRFLAGPHSGRGRGSSRCCSRPPRPVGGGLSPSSPLRSAPRSSFREGPGPLVLPLAGITPAPGMPRRPHRSVKPLLTGPKRRPSFYLGHGGGCWWHSPRQPHRVVC